MTRDQWLQEATALFGENKLDWKFVCPACGFVQAVRDYKDAGAPESAVAFSCVGRWRQDFKEAFDRKDKRNLPCNYAGGGLIQLNPIDVDGKKVFEFAK